MPRRMHWEAANRHERVGTRDRFGWAQARSPSPSSVSAAETRPAAHGWAGLRFEDGSLGELTVAIPLVVELRGRVLADDLCREFSATLGVAGVDRFSGLLASFAWSACGRGFLSFHSGHWIAGPRAPAPIAELAGWTMADLVRTVRQIQAEGGSRKDGIATTVALVSPDPVTIVRRCAEVAWTEAGRLDGAGGSR